MEGVRDFRDVHSRSIKTIQFEWHHAPGIIRKNFLHACLIKMHVWTKLVILFIPCIASTQNKGHVLCFENSFPTVHGTTAALGTSI